MLKRFLQLFQLFFGSRTKPRCFLILTGCLVSIGTEKFLFFLQPVSVSHQFLMLLQPLPFFLPNALNLFFSPNPVQFIHLLPQIVGTNPFQTQKIAVHSHGHPALQGNSIFKIANLPLLNRVHTAQLKFKILLCHLIFNFQQMNSGIRLRLDLLFHQKLRIKQMGIFMCRPVQHIVCNIIILRFHQNTVASWPQKSLYSLPPALVLQTDHIFTGKLSPAVNLSLFKLPIDLIPQSCILRDSVIGIFMFPTVLQDFFLHIQFSVQFLCCLLQTIDLTDFLLIGLLHHLPELFYRAFLLCCRIFPGAQRSQNFFLLRRFSCFHKTVEYFAYFNLKVLQFPAFCPPFSFFFRQCGQPPALFFNHPCSVHPA